MIVLAFATAFVTINKAETDNAALVVVQEVIHRTDSIIKHENAANHKDNNLINALPLFFIAAVGFLIPRASTLSTRLTTSCIC